MRRHRPTRHRVLDEGDSSDEDNGDLNVPSMVDPKVALSMADLGNAARDRLTAHDLGADRNINIDQLEYNRRCNQKGSVEGKNASTNQAQLKGWNSFGGTDSTTNLEDIAGGQYHRQATIQKVQAEIRQLRIDGKEVNAESIDNYQTNSAGRGASTGNSRARGRPLHNNTVINGARPLDPAVDPGRAYKYKSGPAYGADNKTTARGTPTARGSHTGRSSGRGEHIAQLPRNQATSIYNAPAVVASVTGSQRAEPRSRAADRQRIQTRPWPPAALVGNVEPIALSMAKDTTPPFPVATKPLSPPTKTKTAKDQPFAKREKDQAVNTQSTADHPTSRLSNPCAATLSPRKTTSRPVAKALLAHNFRDWFKEAQTGQSALLENTSQVETCNSVHQRSTTESPVKLVQEDSKKADNFKPRLEKDQMSEGRLTPISVSDSIGTASSSQQDKDSPSLRSNQDGTPASTTIKANQGTMEDLLSDEIPAVDQKALQFSGANLLHVSTNSCDGKVISFQAKNPRFPSPSRFLSEHEHSSPSVHELPKNPFVRLRRLEEHSSVAGAADHRQYGPDNATTAALQSKSPNVARGSVFSVSKLADPPTLGQSRPSTTNQPDQASTAGAVFGGPSIFGDSASGRKRGAAVVKTPLALTQSRFAAERPKIERPRIQRPKTPEQHPEEPKPFFKVNKTGPGYEMLLKDLAGLDMEVNRNRRPEETAFTKSRKSIETANITKDIKFTGGIVFPQHRKQPSNMSESDDEL